MMKVFIFTIIILFIIPMISSATSLQGYLDKFRARVAEEDTSQSKFTDSTAKIWANLSAHKINKLAGYQETRQKYIFDRDSAQYALPSDFKVIKGIMLKLQNQNSWQSIFYNPGFNIPDTNVMQYSISRIDPDSAEFHLRFGSVGNTQVDYEYFIDSINYILPADYHQMNQLLILTDGYYQKADENPFFLIDTSIITYYDYNRGDDTSWLYVKGADISDEDTIRVFYEQTAVDGDSMMVQYYAGVDDMVALTDSISVPLDMEPYIIDEMVAYYYQYLRDIQAGMGLIQQNRSDMGIERGVREGGQSVQTGR